MKFIHVENKIDPMDVVRVINEARFELAREIINHLKFAKNHGVYESPEQVIEFVAKLVKSRPEIV